MAHTEEREYPEHSDRLYWITGLVLAILTAMEVGLFIINEQGLIAKWIEVTILLILSFGKGALVVATFMHLRGDAPPFKFVFFAPFLMASAMLLSFLLIYGPGHVGIAG
jgi:cytochrome c oxidase subunit 4/cytochrome o ubiquinol oxidase operon protein cyoD